MSKRVLKVLSLISGIMVIVTLLAGIPTLFDSKNWFIHFAMFNMLRSGGIFGFIGNLASILILAYLFGAMCYRGLIVCRSAEPKALKSALIAGVATAVITLISLICSICMHSFNFGDIVLTAIPVVYIFCVFREIKVN